MKAFGKVLGLFFLGLLLLVVALGFALTHLFDPNDYKDEIRQIARDKANLELDLKGDIGWSLFPWLGLELHDTSIASTATPTKPFADLQMLGLSVRVLPLLRKDVQMSAIGTVAKLAMRQPFVLFKGLTFQKLCLPGAFRPGDHHNKMLRPGLCVVHASPQYL
ncbi:AsmA family protein [Pseudomonas aeruginosa NCGM2.S1]|nr:AsmA family protein [Pseudomonas aeruginosa NCGM2.S1]